MSVVCIRITVITAPAMPAEPKGITNVEIKTDSGIQQTFIIFPNLTELSTPHDVLMELSQKFATSATHLCDFGRFL